MEPRRLSPRPQAGDPDWAPDRWEDYLSPEQRLDLIADILARIVARMIQAEE
jgi:hypothetical protein